MSPKIFVSFLAIFSICNAIPLETSKALNTNRIVGGTPAPPGFAPHMVGLRLGIQFKSYICGGSLISMRHVLTAAHCVEPFIWYGSMRRTYHGVAGATKWYTGGMEFEFSEHHLHPDYDGINLKSDAAILTIEHDLPISESIGVIALDFSEQKDNVKCYVTGWGLQETWGSMPELLQVLEVTTIPHEECERRIQTAGEVHGLPWVPPVDARLEVCTLHSPGHGMCNGDSGGALVSVQTGKQIGIVSWGLPCAHGVPDVAAATAALEPFVRSVVKELGDDDKKV